MLSDTVIRTDPVTGATSHLLELSLTQRRKLLALERVLKMASYENKPLFLRNAKSGKVALAIPAPSHMDEEGELIRRFELVRLRSEYILAGGWTRPQSLSPRPSSARCGKQNTPLTRTSW